MNFGNFTSALAVTLLMTTGAWAGEQYVDKTGYAASGYDVVSFFSLGQKAIGTVQHTAIKGHTNFVTTHNGSKWAFSSARNLLAFKSNPDKFTPAYDGHCAYGVSKGGKVPGNPNLWRIVDNQLYFNITKNVVGFWEEDIPGNISLANGNWTGIEPSGSSKSKIPQFAGSNAPIGG